MPLQVESSLLSSLFVVFFCFLCDSILHFELIFFVCVFAACKTNYLLTDGVCGKILLLVLMVNKAVQLNAK